MIDGMAVIAVVAFGCTAYLSLMVAIRMSNRSNRRVWERIVTERENYVKAGCPLYQRNKWGRWELHYDPFMIDYPYMGSLRSFPDLFARNEAAEAAAVAIHHKRPSVDLWSELSRLNAQESTDAG